LTLTLQFDRAVGVSDMDGTNIIVNDPVTKHQSYAAIGGVTAVNPTTVRIGLFEQAPVTGTQVTLDAAASSGIVAVDDGGTWAGVTDLELPYT
jgi:hypothetical protein